MTIHHKHLLIKFSSKTLLFEASQKFIIGVCFVHMTIPSILDTLSVASSFHCHRSVVMEVLVHIPSILDTLSVASSFHCHRSVVMEVLVHISLSTSLSMSLKTESVNCSVVSNSLRCHEL